MGYNVILQFILYLICKKKKLVFINSIYFHTQMSKNAYKPVRRDRSNKDRAGIYWKRNIKCIDTEWAMYYQVAAS